MSHDTIMQLENIPTVHNMADFPKKLPPIYIENLPSGHDHYCRITVCVSEDVVKLAAQLLAPLANCLAHYADSRTEWERERDRSLSRYRADLLERQKQLEHALFSVALAVWRKGLSYHEAQELLSEKCKFHYTLSIPKRQLHNAYHGLRARKAAHLRQKGMTHKEIGALIGVREAAVGAILKREV